MTLIDQKYLNQLRSSGLFVSHPFGAFLGGVWIVKPCGTRGNHIPNYSASGGYNSVDNAPVCPDSDAPMLKFICVDESRWRVDGQDSAGSIGPADFINEWSTAEEAIKDILDFFFGDSARMILKGAEKEKQRTAREAKKLNAQ